MLFIWKLCMLTKTYCAWTINRLIECVFFFLCFPYGQARNRTSAWCAARRSASRLTSSHTCASTRATSRSRAACATRRSSGRSTCAGTGRASTPGRRPNSTTSPAQRPQWPSIRLPRPRWPNTRPRPRRWPPAAAPTAAVSVYLFLFLPLHFTTTAVIRFTKSNVNIIWNVPINVVCTWLLSFYSKFSGVHV